MVNSGGLKEAFKLAMLIFNGRDTSDDLYSLVFNFSSSLKNNKIPEPLLDQIEKILNESSIPIFKTQNLALIGSKHLENGNLDKSLAVLNKIPGMSSGKFNFLRGLGTVFTKSGNLEKAKEIRNKLIS